MKKGNWLNNLLIGFIVAVFGLLIAMFFSFSERLSNLEGSFEVMQNLPKDVKTNRYGLEQLKTEFSENKRAKSLTERKLVLSPIKKNFKKEPEMLSGDIVYYDNNIGYFSGKISAIGLKPKHAYLISLNGKPEHSSNELFNRKNGPEGYIDIGLVKTDSSGIIKEQAFLVDLPPGQYNSKLFVKDIDSYKPVLFSNFLVFTVNYPSATDN